MSDRSGKIVSLASAGLFVLAVAAVDSTAQEGSGAAVAIRAGRVVDGLSDAPLGP